jgi:hypothetical protein
MTINTFKKFCIKADTKKSDEIHDYYIKLEEIMHITIDEQTTELQKQLQTSNNDMLLKDTQHAKELKIKKHDTLIQLLKSKRCVYIGEIEEGVFIKIGSSQEVDYRAGRLQKTYGDMIFLEVFECQNFREVEASILKDKTIMKHLYKKPIKANGSKSLEVVKLTETFTYNDLFTIVNKYVSDGMNLFMSPEQLLEKYKIDKETELELRKTELEKQKLDYNFLLTIINNDKFAKNNDFIDIFNIISEKIKDMVSSDMKPPIEQEKPENKISASTTKAIEEVNKNAKKPQGRKIQKIDPKDITKVITTYDSMIYLLRCPENEKLKRYSILEAIDDNTIYQGYRWNFVEKNDDPNVSKAKPTNTSKKEYKTDVILELNNTKTKILGSYSTKISLLTKLGITKKKLNKIIQEKTRFDDCYYIFHKDCPKTLLKDFDCPTTRTIKTSNSKPIIQINPVTKTEHTFNSFDELNIKLGIKKQTIKKAIENNTLCGGSIWKYRD